MRELETTYIERLGLLPTTSCLRRLPADLDPRESLSLDGIQVAIDSIDYLYRELRVTLAAITDLRSTCDNTAFVHAWSIVDWAHRLSLLLQHLPRRSKPKPWPAFRRFQNYDVKAFRDGFQHLDERIRDPAASQNPILGSLSWFYATDSSKGTAALTMAGSFKPGTRPFVDFAGKRVRPPVDLIELSAFDVSLSLRELVDTVGELARVLEAVYAPRFDGRDTVARDTTRFVDHVDVNVQFVQEPSLSLDELL